MRTFQTLRVLSLFVIVLLFAGMSGSTCAPAPDADGDGVADSIDNCPQTPNADQIDSNVNGSGDACDPVDECQTALAGTTASAHPELVGVGERDTVIPFEIANAAGTVLYKAEFKDSVLRSSQTGTLVFMSQIRGVQAGLPGKLEIVRLSGFTGHTVSLIEYRTDGAGVVGPDCASKSADGDAITFRFHQTPLEGTTESRLMLVVTNASEFVTTGQTVLRLTTGESIVLTTAAPIPAQP